MYRADGMIEDLCRTSSDVVILATPNLWFPVIAHDTRLPFAHWLPIPLRKIYARAFGRTGCENDNLFWSPRMLKREMKGFRRLSKWLHYASFKKFKRTFPYYLPYGKGKHVSGLGKCKTLYYGLLEKLGIYSHWFSPSLACVFERRR